MTWQYLTLVVHLTPEGGEVVMEQKRSAAASDGSFPALQDRLNQYGSLGWELQSTLPHGDGTVLFLLRRPGSVAEEMQRLETDIAARRQAEEYKAKGEVPPEWTIPASSGSGYSSWFSTGAPKPQPASDEKKGDQEK